jgi:hypothetical protein
MLASQEGEVVLLLQFCTLFQGVQDDSILDFPYLQFASLHLIELDRFECPLLHFAVEVLGDIVVARQNGVIKEGDALPELVSLEVPFVADQKIHKS